jgi:deoxyguanosine kinase
MLIVVEGCLGAGKTTVAKGLAAIRGSEFLLEDFESHPFLRAFYEDPVGNALETEFTFLFLHFHQLKSKVEAASKTEVISDFHLGKDLLYADLNLNDPRAQRAFSNLYEICLEKTPHPALLVFLSASTELLIERVRARRRDFEVDVQPEYLAAVSSAYEAYFTGYVGPKLRVRMDDWDFVREPALFDKLGALVDRELRRK